jgi:hypothetical protein
VLAADRARQRPPLPAQAPPRRRRSAARTEIPERLDALQRGPCDVLLEFELLFRIGRLCTHDLDADDPLAGRNIEAVVPGVDVRLVLEALDRDQLGKLDATFSKRSRSASNCSRVLTDTDRSAWPSDA